MRHGALMAELEACVGDNGVRVVVLSSPRGAGLTTALRSFAEEVRGRGDRADVIDCERVGVQPGGVVDGLLRTRLGLGPATTGQALLETLDTSLPDLDPLAREFLAFAMGFTRDDFQTARLDPKSRWEGALAEVGRWLASSSGGTWAWVFDDAVSADAESVRLVEQLAQGATTPGLVVLAVRDDERLLLEPRLRLLRTTGRVKELALPPLDLQSLAAAFPTTAASARGVVLTARLLQSAGLEGGAPTTAEALVRRLAPQLPTIEGELLGVLSACGGRLPFSALEAVLGAGQADVVRSLEGRMFVRRGPTLRCGGEDEVWLRFPAQMPEVPAASARTWLTAVGAWAEAALLRGTSPALWQVALPQAIRAAEAVGDTARLSLAWELSARLGGGTFSLRKAEATASGVRRLVLGRLLAEDELFRGEVQRSLTTAAAVGQLASGGSLALPAAWSDVVTPRPG